TVSAGAKDFGDSADLSGEAYEEAVNVMSEMGIIDGYSDGDFRPQGTLTRGAAAKIIACMMLGKTTAEALGTSAAPFKDVPAGSTFAGYIAYCVESGLIDGYADGTFRPQNTLTGFAFLKMLLTALGYDSSIEGYTGTNWTVNVAGRATQIGLTTGNDDFVGSRAATREEACLYAANALRTTLVEYDSKGTNVVVNGATVAIGASKPTYVTSSIAGAATSIDDTKDNQAGDYTVEFAERYQPDLELDHDTDAFGRPARTWSWKNRDIGTYVDFDLLVAEYTEKVTGEELYDLLGKSTIADSDFYIYVDGVEAIEDNEAYLSNAYFTEGRFVRGNRDSVGETGNGVLTQVFVDPNAGSDGEVTIAVINTYLAVADGDYDERDESIDFDVWGIDAKNIAKDIYVKDTSDTDPDPSVVKFNNEPFTVKDEDISVADYVDGDVVLVTVADGAIQTVADPEVMSEVTITGFKSGRGGNLTTGGTRYSYNDAAAYDEDALIIYTGNGTVNLKDTTYNVYLDQYGYVAGVEEVDAEKQYVFITGVDENYSNLTNRNYDATAIFLDGTIETIEIDARDTKAAGVNFNTDAKDKTWKNTAPTSRTTSFANVNEWYTYTVDRNGVYTLRNVDNQTAMDNDQVVGGITMNEKNIDLKVGTSKYVFGNDETVYINTSVANVTTEVASDDDVVVTVIDDVESVVTGVRNVDIDALSVNNKTADKNETASYYVADEVFPLWDDDSWLIGVVVIGEDQGVSSDYAYVHTDSISQETYTDEDGNHHWFRDVLIDGKVTELEYVDDSINVLNSADMTQGNWVRVYYNADGTVRRVEDVPTLSTVPAVLSGTDDIEVYSETLSNDFDGDADDDELYYESGSLYVIKDNARNGFSIRPDVKVVYINAKAGGSGDYDEVVDGLEGIDGLRTALKRVNDNFNGTVNVIFDDDVASVIVLHNTSKDPGYNPGSDASYGFKLTGVTNVSKGSSGSDQWLEADLVGTGDLPAGSSALVELWKQNDSEGNAMVDDSVFTGCNNLGSDTPVNSIDKVTASGVFIPESGNYYLVIKIVDANGNVMDSVTTDSRYFAV
ncbi:S-layer homology domain-containing protein, partial [Oscillibacter valericigenes]